MVRNVASHVAHVTVFLHTTVRVLWLLESVLLDVCRGGEEMTVKQVFILFLFFIIIIFYLMYIIV